MGPAARSASVWSFENQGFLHASAILRQTQGTAMGLIPPRFLQAIKSEGGFVWACKNYDGE